MITKVRRLLAGALTAVAVTPASAAAQAPVPVPASAAPAAPVLAWKPCGREAPAPFECASAAVPLDYEQPAGATIPLAVVRRPASKPAARIGTLFINPGGPGGSGVDTAVDLAPLLPAALRDRFDIVGFDPRGVARSSEVACWTRREYDAAFAATRVITGEPSLAASLRTARGFVDACRLRSGALLPYVGTEYVARDMDLVRAAVGDDRLTYLGLSYGTYIGTVYANLFPDHVRALVLDGAYDPAAYRDRPYDYDRGQYVALEGALSRFLRWCSNHAGRCGFGRGRAFAAFDALMARLDADPQRVAGGTVDAAAVEMQIAFMLDAGRDIWPTLGTSLAEADRTGGLQPFGPTSRALVDLLSPNTAVECADRAFPRNRALLRRELRAESALGRRLGRLFAYGPPSYDHGHATACTQWPRAAAEESPSRYTDGFAAAGAPPVVVVGTTGDPDTPYADAVALTRTLASAKLVTFRGEGHTAFLRSDCVTTQVTNYLVDLALPGKEVCSDEAPLTGG